MKAEEAIIGEPFLEEFSPPEGLLVNVIARLYL